MTREHIEFVLSEYSTDALADKLLELFDEEAASYQHTINELNKALSENKEIKELTLLDTFKDGTGKVTEIWAVKGKLQIRTHGTIHNCNGIFGNDISVKSVNGSISVFPDSAENKGEWVPITKWTPANDPPKETGRYLVYIVNEYDEKLQYQMTADYIARPEPIEGLSPWTVDDECASDNVVAWMPLPEGYKAESEESE